MNTDDCQSQCGKASVSFCGTCVAQILKKVEHSPLQSPWDLLYSLQHSPVVILPSGLRYELIRIFNIPPLSTWNKKFRFNEKFCKGKIYSWSSQVRRSSLEFMFRVRNLTRSVRLTGNKHSFTRNKRMPFKEASAIYCEKL